eukprot:NODE_71_length_24927_cov_1.205937.p6 type:complete len:427 gc:universal NODE_71_length_24927_cov_1.205937:24422-23142(-)
MSFRYELYCDLQNTLTDPVTISKENVLSAPQIQREANVIKNNMGWRTGKGNFALISGSWYYEITLIEGHCRVGFAQISADLQSYPGYDSFGYGFSNTGRLYHQAIARETFESRIGFKVGDTVGILIELPDSQTEEEEAILISRRWNPKKLYGCTTVNQPEVEIWKEGSRITYFINGQIVKGFPSLYLGTYYPAIGIWKGGAVKVNFGPTFEYSIPGGAKPYSEAQSAPVCVGKPYDSEEVLLLQNQRLEQFAADALKQDVEESILEREPTIRQDRVIIQSPIRRTPKITLNRTPNKFKRKGGDFSSPIRYSPELSYQRAPYVSSLSLPLAGNNSRTISSDTLKTTFTNNVDASKLVKVIGHTKSKEPETSEIDAMIVDTNEGDLPTCIDTLMKSPESVDNMLKLKADPFSDLKKSSSTNSFESMQE